MRIIHSAPSMGPAFGGLYEAVRRMAQAEWQPGVETQVRMPWSEDAAKHAAEWAPAKISVHGKISVSALGWSRAFAKALLGADGDILHTHGIWQHSSWVALDWKKRHGKPHVASVHGMLEPWAWQNSAWKKRPIWWLWEKKNLQSASLLHATSEQEVQALRERGLNGAVAVIPNGVDLPDESELEPIAGRNEGCRTALFLSRIHPKKGLPMLLEAWAKLKPAGWNLLIAGPDESGHRAELERQCKGLGLGEIVSFSGPLGGKEKADAFRECSLFVLPTHSENFGIVVAEALAYERPVITTHGAPWQSVEETGSGWWVPVDEGALGAALGDATSRSPEELNSMGSRGRQMVTERFGWDLVAKQLLGCYRWLLREGERPSCVIRSDGARADSSTMN